MKSVTGLYLTMCIMNFAILANITIFHGKWNGITMSLCTLLLIVGTGFFVSAKMNKNSL
ncbi:hypothetical protein J5Y03_17690 [Bacillus sp. RG28]|uniref:Uncharacterized protein n=1 Tax=Gottfriedia endophytica TaxID=2820819 RepID=A0A940SLD0_9BACI|nr:hypothetical protein [Gottfriedia endophytica]MBP0726994.1 hypothetical protein [Gottfriedia endophytica]